MLNEKLLDVLSHPTDGAISIVTNGDDGPHLVNTWNSYIVITPEDKLLIPAYGYNKTEKTSAFITRLLFRSPARKSRVTKLRVQALS